MDIFHAVLDLHSLCSKKSIEFMFQKKKNKQTNKRSIVFLATDNSDILSFMQSCCDQNIAIQSKANREGIKMKNTALGKINNEWLKVVLLFQFFLLSFYFVTRFVRVVIKLPKNLIRSLIVLKIATRPLACCLPQLH